MDQSMILQFAFFIQLSIMSICNCCYYQNKCFYSILFCSILKYIFDAFDQSEVFPDLMKIAIVSPVFKTGDTADTSNYGPIFFLPRFSKILERVMYSSPYKHLTDQKILHPQQFGFRKGYSTEHAVAHLVDQIFVNHLRTTTSLLTSQSRLTQSIIQYF